MIRIIKVNLIVQFEYTKLFFLGEGLSEYAWAFPENHSRAFSSNLVIPDPECRVIDLTPDCQFFIVACDGLWDVIDGQQAVDIAKANFERGCTPQVLEMFNNDCFFLI